jgi:hypothetical protein
MFSRFCLAVLAILGAVCLGSIAQADPVGPEFFVNPKADNGYDNDIAPLKDSGFVATWTTFIADNQTNIQGRRFDTDGAPVGGAFTVSTLTQKLQHESSVAGLADGSFVVTWSKQQGANGHEIAGQRFDAAGAPDGGEFLVNTHKADDQRKSEVIGLSNGGFMVVWHSNNHGPRAGQIYNASGASVGDEFPAGADTDFFDCVGAGAIPSGGFVLTRGVRVKHDGSPVRADLYAQRRSNTGRFSDPRSRSTTT